MSGSSTDHRSADAPWLSVVVVSFNDEEVLARSLSALTAQARPGHAEILVAADAGRVTDSLRRRFLQVQWIDAPAGATVPERRALGFSRSRGRVVALIEDDCVVEPGWMDAVRQAHATDDAVIGGTVEPGPYHRALDWAIYFCEYGRFMRPPRKNADIVLALAGNHLTYKRQALADLPASDAGFFDYFVHDDWRRRGIPMRVETALGVQNVNHWTARHATAVPFHHGRAFAARRALGRSAVWRVGMAAMCPALPLLKAGRIINDTLSRRRFVGRLIPALPWIVAFVTCWSLGEAIGYLAGPGSSPSRWR